MQFRAPHFAMFDGSILNIAANGASQYLIFIHDMLRLITREAKSLEIEHGVFKSLHKFRELDPVNHRIVQRFYFKFGFPILE